MTLPVLLVPSLLSAVPAGWVATRAARAFVAGAVTPAVVIGVMFAAFGWAVAVMPPDWRLVAALGLGWMLTCLATIDVLAFRLPDALTLPLLAAGLVVSLGLPGAPILDHMIGALAGWGLLAGVGWIYLQWRGVDGVGLGDAKLLGAAGAWLGWTALPSVLLIACGASFVWIAVVLAMHGRIGLSTRIAFGAPLCLGFWTVWLHGPLAM